MELIYRQATTADADSILNLYYGEDINSEKHDYVVKSLKDYPSFVVLAGNHLIGFVYCNRFAPDILELANMYVDESMRSQGVGGRLLELVEQAAAKTYAAIVLVNSELYSLASKRAAAGFYIHQGYQLAFTTGPTRVFTKKLTDTV